MSHPGLALAGALLGQSSLRKRLNEISLGQRKRPEAPHGEVLVAMIGLLCLGKSDFADIEAYRQEESFRGALGLAKLPSEETLRQRMDAGCRGRLASAVLPQDLALPLPAAPQRPAEDPRLGALLHWQDARGTRRLAFALPGAITSGRRQPEGTP